MLMWLWSFVLQLEVMSAVREVQSTIQEMLARQEFTAALDLISTTQDLLHSELSTIRSLNLFSGSPKAEVPGILHLQIWGT
ncbi:Vacuolar protein sorting-associated protein 54 [Portunus trituberculatus]|uniref:Vacuolar protein sorting-associated protein 54 n=1 Tax=Portunus trituberculatus TaxID=210409 RepID=A0A5B7G436_PORTR|nr:Vacuolar protein sorting-associated protein 54 [Portunus trituberculatus]